LLLGRGSRRCDRRREAHVSNPTMEEKDLREHIHTFLVARLHIILASGLLATCSCDGNGLRMTAHDAGVAGGSGGVIGSSGSSPDAGVSRSGGATSTGGKTGSGGVTGGTGNTGGTSSTQGSTSSHALGANQCREDGDCDVQEQATCVSPGGQAPCAAACPPAECASDSDCQAEGPSFICEGAWQCGECAAGVKICISGCVDTSGCDAGEVCMAHRCVPASCQSDVDCPTDFECAGGSCGRKGCTTDANCSGYCVNGLCYSTPGACHGAVA
jgi:hypothetical protein